MRREEFNEAAGAHFSWKLRHHNWHYPVATVAGSYAVGDTEVFFGALLAQRAEDVWLAQPRVQVITAPNDESSRWVGREANRLESASYDRITGILEVMGARICMPGQAELEAVDITVPLLGEGATPKIGDYLLTVSDVTFLDQYHI
jgi:hypothetical protein